MRGNEGLALDLKDLVMENCLCCGTSLTNTEKEAIFVQLVCSKTLLLSWHQNTRGELLEAAH